MATELPALTFDEPVTAPPAPFRWLLAMPLALAWLIMLLGGTGTADQQILKTVYGGAHPTVVAVARFLTFVGSTPVGLPLVTLALVLLWFRRGRAGAIAGLIVIASGRLLVEAQKYGIHRLRPRIEPHLAVATSPSFPSGHAANSMIACLTFAILMFGTGSWKRSAIAIAIALLLSFLIGLSRPVLGVHWPSDVIGGWAFGLLWVLLILPLAKRIARGYSSAAHRGGPNGQ